MSLSYSELKKLKAERQRKHLEKYQSGELKLTWPLQRFGRVRVAQNKLVKVNFD